MKDYKLIAARADAAEKIYVPETKSPKPQEKVNEIFQTKALSVPKWERVMGALQWYREYKIQSAAEDVIFKEIITELKSSPSKITSHPPYQKDKSPAKPDKWIPAAISLEAGFLWHQILSQGEIDSLFMGSPYEYGNNTVFTPEEAFNIIKIFKKSTVKWLNWHDFLGGPPRNLAEGFKWPEVLTPREIDIFFNNNDQRHLRYGCKTEFTPEEIYNIICVLKTGILPEK